MRVKVRAYVVPGFLLLLAVLAGAAAYALFPQRSPVHAPPPFDVVVEADRLNTENINVFSLSVAVSARSVNARDYSVSWQVIIAAPRDWQPTDVPLTLSFTLPAQVTVSGCPSLMACFGNRDTNAVTAAGQPIAYTYSDWSRSTSGPHWCISQPDRPRRRSCSTEESTSRFMPTASRS